jgi:hypothetical protein
MSTNRTLYDEREPRLALCLCAFKFRAFSNTHEATAFASGGLVMVMSITRLVVLRLHETPK